LVVISVHAVIVEILKLFILLSITINYIDISLSMYIKFIYQIYISNLYLKIIQLSFTTCIHLS